MPLKCKHVLGESSGSQQSPNRTEWELPGFSFVSWQNKKKKQNLVFLKGKQYGRLKQNKTYAEENLQENIPPKRMEIKLKMTI